MRAIVTVVLLLVFVPGFIAYFLLGAVLDYTRDTGAVVETAKAAGVRDTVIGVTEAFVYRELARDPQLATVQRDELRRIVSDVISEAWFDDTLRAAHGSLVAAIDDASENAVIDLRRTKSDLRDGMSRLGRRIDAECAVLLGGGSCSGEVEAVVAAFERHTTTAIEDIPDQLDIARALSGGRSRDVLEVDEIRSRIADVKSYRSVALAVLLVCFALIGFVNLKPLRRLLLATGFALLLGCGGYLLALGVVTGDVAKDRVAEVLEREQGRRWDPASPEGIAITGAEKFAREVVERSAGASKSLVIVLALAGAGLTVGGFVLRR